MCSWEYLCLAVSDVKFFSCICVVNAVIQMCRVFRDSGASEPRNMAYMTRLGLWGPGTPFPAFQDFIDAIEKRSFVLIL